MPLLIYLRHVVSIEHRTILYTLQQGIPCCYLIQSHLSHFQNHFSWIHFKITNSPLSTESFMMISSKQNFVHFVFNPRMQHDLPCRNGVRSYDTSFCSGHHIFGGESSPYWFRNHYPRKSCSAYYAGPKGRVLQINKSFVSRSPSENKTVEGTWKNSRTTRAGGIGDDFPQTVPQLRRPVDGFLPYELDFDHRTVYFEIFVGKMAMELDVSWWSCLWGLFIMTPTIHAYSWAMEIT
jgi:hypothetical protein